MTIIGAPATARGIAGHQLLLENVSVGDQIPIFTLPLTLQRLVMEAGVNRDFTPLHHDDEDTRRTGASRSYANTIFIQALIEAALRTWMGDCGLLRELGIKMISFNLAGTVVSVGGVVTAIDVHTDGTHGDISLDIWMRSNEMLTVTGTAIIRLPADSVVQVVDGSTVASEEGKEGDRQ